MYIGKQSIRITQDVDRVYSIARTYPSFVSFFLDGSKILFQDEKTLLVQVQTRLLGLKTSWFGSGIMTPPKRIQFSQTKGLFRGLKARWSFVPNGRNETKVTICTSFSKPLLSPVGERLLGIFLVERVTARILSELKGKSETL